MEYIEQIFFRKINPSDFRNMYALAVPSSGGGQTYIEAAGITDNALFTFLEYAEMADPTSKGETRMVYKFNCHTIGDKDASAILEFQPRRNRNYRIARQTEANRHPAWSVAKGFPQPEKSSDGQYKDDSTFSGIIDNLLVVIIRTSYRKYYAWYINEGHIPSDWPQAINLEQMFSGERRGILVFGENVLGFVDNTHCPFDLKGTAKGCLKSASLSGMPLQLISYGAPGTGKSDGMNEVVGEYIDTERTTFHPDSDFASFVGSYKPRMKSVQRINCIDDKAKDVTDAKGNPSNEDIIVYEFTPQAFTKAYIKAWQKMANPSSDGDVLPQFLVVEEINRGNCAQIFGDIFQLLDRENGYSKYPISADDDLRIFLEKEFRELSFEPKYAKVKTGDELVLPPNLYIWATMNTSDQSLFPMDSAFKRRWTWSYTPIREGVRRQSTQKLDWEIDVITTTTKEDGTEESSHVRYSWWNFLQKINKRIFKLTDSEDKMLGYFFVTPESGKTISDVQFVNKVIFYLWNDVYKNYGTDNLFRGQDNGATNEEDKMKGVPFTDFFDLNSVGKVKASTITNFFKVLEVSPHPSPTSEGAATESDSNMS